MSISIYEFLVVSSDEDNFSAGDEEFFSPDLEEPQSTCSSNADCPSNLSCIRYLQIIQAYVNLHTGKSIIFFTSSTT